MPTPYGPRGSRALEGMSRGYLKTDNQYETSKGIGEPPITQLGVELHALRSVAFFGHSHMCACN